MSKPKRALMIADSDSFWTQRYLEHLLLPEGYEVTIFPIWGDGGRYADFYEKNGVTVYRDRHTLPVVGRIPRARMWARIALNARDLKAMGPFDLVHNHYLSQRDLALGQRLAAHFHARWACSFWGSDLLRASARELERMRAGLERCDAISVHNELSREKIRGFYGEAMARKTALLYFGQTMYAAIDRAREAHGGEGAPEAADERDGRGAEGAHGTAGARGAEGANGTAGARGAEGANGTAGARGGADGRGAEGARSAADGRGAKGANGMAGARSAADERGTAGAHGTAGARGAADERGTAGAHGTAGARGAEDARSAEGATSAACKAYCKSHFGIDPSRLTVCVGYNASSAQQQLEVLESMSCLPPRLMERVTVILQQTYGENDPDYVRRVRECAGRLPCRTVVLTQFLNEPESALLRLAADVFILAIRTDAFSASMQEYLYAGACVLKGAWLGYPQLTQMGVEVAEFATFAEIPALLSRALTGELTGLAPEQRALFPKLYSWDAVRESWLALYRA